MIANGEPRIAQLIGVGIEPLIKIYKKGESNKLPRKRRRRRRKEVKEDLGCIVRSYNKKNKSHSLVKS